MYDDISINYNDDLSILSKKTLASKNEKKKDKIQKKVYNLKKKVDDEIITFKIYPSSIIPGSNIKNAITGIFYDNLYIGTYDEDYLFSVAYSVGNLGKDTLFLFYDNPSQYEEHFNIKLNEKIINNWNTKQYNINNKKIDNHKKI